MTEHAMFTRVHPGIPWWYWCMERTYELGRVCPTYLAVVREVVRDGSGHLWVNTNVGGVEINEYQPIFGRIFQPVGTPAGMSTKKLYDQVVTVLKLSMEAEQAGRMTPEMQQIAEPFRHLARELGFEEGA